MNASRTFTLLALCALGLTGCPADPEPGNTGASSTTTADCSTDGCAHNSSTTTIGPDDCATGGGPIDECCQFNQNYCPEGYSSSTTLDCSTDGCSFDSSTTVDCSTDGCAHNDSTTLDCSTGGCDSSTTVGPDFGTTSG
ncbi:MAG: hypothetical protein AAGF11_22815 [Myxococcota bacterium]